MNINRHNYEEYFILYMDNELGAEERRMVEAFAALHPDLKEELEILLQYKMVPDTAVQYEGKEELLREQGCSPITLLNYEEWLSLYIDNELAAEQKLSVEDFIAENPAIQKELGLLQRTKLQPGTIVFDHKETLYRREEKVRPVVTIRWWRAAAAVLLLTAGISAVFILNKKPATGKDEVAKSGPDLKKTPVENSNPGPVAVESKNTAALNPLAAEKPAQQDVPANNRDNNKALAVTNQKETIPANKITGNSPALIKDDAPMVADNSPKPNNNLPQPVNNPNTTIKKPNDAIAYTPVPEKIQLQNALTNNNVTSPLAQPSNIVQASYNENEDAVFDQADGKKNKSRGIFRKIARTFEKRTNMDPTDDNRLLVGGLAIKLK